ncbi:putative 26S proteasome non-atpase regulatory subunit 8 [Testicularia cyperi]|uniref:Putative 26S proteasome non-atpase regulatory subunit 8 n=1 Tax=Testicularia cyperi TaxID=1882483 RepID=A0A317XYB2_9BASI|nr:putative 26S proteasome non-atpase regulatory subunit 8 [Testicularia cyperi]
MDLQTLHSQLVAAFTSPTPNLDAMRPLLTKLKIVLTELNLLVPDLSSLGSSSSSSSSSAGALSANQIALARDVLEIGAFWSVRVHDVASFDRYMSLLEHFYEHESEGLPSSENKEPLWGLKLLRLLSSNQITAFHIALETIPPNLLSSTYIQHPVKLERWLMEGSYSKVWRLSREQPPKEEYAFFVDQLLHMIRTEIASCEEKAYDSLPLQDAATLLFFDNLQDVLSFAQQRGWQVNPTTQTIDFAIQNATNSNAIPKKQTITNNLLFAKELESIV